MTTDARIESALGRAIDLGEVGVQVAAYLGTDLIIDDWIGVADESTERVVDEQTLFNVFSVTKAILATAIHVEAERGHLDIHDPIAKYWPEYGTRGKDAIRIQHVLEHTAGVPQMPPDLTPEGMQDWYGIVEWLADVEPVCAPGIRSISHSISFGHILGEVLRRTDPGHRLFGAYVRDEFCTPLGIKDIWVGLPTEQEGRVARLTWGSDPPEGPLTARVPMRELSMPIGIVPSPEPWNSPLMHQACIPAAGAIMTARDGAKFFSLLAMGGELEGHRLLSEERLLAQAAYRKDPLMQDEALGEINTMGIGGYLLSSSGLPEGKPGVPRRPDPVVDQGPHVLVLEGAGGSIGWANLDTRLSAVITHNRMFGHVPTDKHPFVALGHAIRSVAGVKPQN
jgi:CubicO group peptidase (beta-lactamase class C family)